MIPVVYFLALLIPSASGSCNLGWVEHEGSCYSFNKEKLSWFEAAATCLVYEAHLVQVDSAEKNAWLATQLRGASIVSAWLGGTARLHSSIWEWVPSFRRIGNVGEESGLPCDGEDDEGIVNPRLDEFYRFLREAPRDAESQLRRQADARKKRVIVDSASLDDTSELNRSNSEGGSLFDIEDGEQESGLLENRRNTDTESLPGSKPPTTYLNWATGEPNNQAVRFELQENCLEITRSKRYKWNNVDCKQTISFICEKDA